MTVSTNLAHNRYIRQATRHIDLPTLPRVVDLFADIEAFTSALIVGFAVLGGVMAVFSGYGAAAAYRCFAGSPPHALRRRIGAIRHGRPARVALPRHAGRPHRLA